MIRAKTFVPIIAAVLVIAIAVGYLLVFRVFEVKPIETSTPTVSPTPTVIYKSIDVLKVSQRADLSTIDVHVATDAPTLAVLSHVYETLFKIKFDESGRASFVPHLVENYRQINETVWEFKLRPNVKFHDGGYLTSRDVKASFERGPRVGGLPRILLETVKAVEIVDDFTFRLILKYPFAPIIAHLAHPSTAIIPAWVAEKFPNVTIDDVKYIVGTGPYKFVEFKKLERTVLEAFDEYWGEKPTVKRIEWIPVPDDSTRIAYLEAGTVDVATHIPPHMVTTLKAKGFNIVQIPSTRIIYIGINVERINDIRVRQAMNFAVDKNSIVKAILEGAGSIATAPIPPAVFGYTKLEPYTYDVDKARQLIREAGWEGREILFITPQGRYLRDREIADAIRAYLEQIGLRVKVEVMEWASYIQRVTTQKDFDIFLLGWSTVTLDADYGLYSLFRAGAPFNRMQYNNTRVNELLDKARVESDPQKRLQLYAEAQRIIWEEAPWIFLHYEDIIVASKQGLVGLEIQPIERWIFTYVKLVASS